ncbi:MAG: hypothetical protein ACFCD0_22570 [Gemmataceae bacterium]
MGLFIRFSISFAFIISCFVGISWTSPQWAHELGVDFWRWPEISCMIHKEAERSEQLRAERALILERTEAKSAILEEFITEKIDLKTAAEKLHARCDEWFLKKGLPSMPMKGTTTKEKFCRLVLHWAATHLRHHPLPGENVMPRLEAQLEEAITQVNI